MILRHREEVIREFCTISALAYHSISDYTDPADGFCLLCPFSDKPSFRHDERFIQYIREAVLEKLKKDGYKINKGFNPITGKAICDE